MLEPIEIWRNFIIAPISEELVFRSIMIPALYFPHYPIYTQGYTITTILYLCPLFFSLVHLHHLYEKLRNGQPFRNALLQVLIQATYTYIFGFMSTVLFTRTGNICSCILSHIICNIIGLPNIGFLHSNGVEQLNGNKYSFMYPYRVILLILHGLGLLLFFNLIYYLTQDMASQSIYWQSYIVQQNNRIIP